jgi:quinoprotein glucose dehydrogenase
MRWILFAAAAAIFAAAAHADAGWSHWGGDEGGLRYSPAAEITPKNVDELVPIWTFSTGDLARRDAKTMRRSAMQSTPILVGDKLLVCTPFNEAIALDPGTGKQLWRFDPKIPTEKVFPANKFNCRGVATWTDETAAPGTPCRERVLAATNNAHVIALDYADGKPCADFGKNGDVAIDVGMELKWPGEFQITSAPVVVGDVVIVGSSISDNARVAAPHGTVRAFDVRTGAAKWSWDPVPRDPVDPAAKTWGEGNKEAGHANVWAPMSVDSKRGLVFMPTSSPSPDFFGGLRPGDNKHANSVVALKGETGELVWAFQTVHHDVWDYDNPAQPTLATIEVGGAKRDVVIQPTKQSFIFVLDRDTGEPVYPVEERPVPQGGVEGEALSPTQPYPTHFPPLAPQKITPDDAYGLTSWDRDACRSKFAAARSEGLYTPPSLQGTILFPMTGGGINWGGVTIDPVNQVLYANTTRGPHVITLFASEKFDELDAKYPDKEVAPQTGARYGMIREILLSPLGLPCNNPPWGVLSAVDMKTGKVLWESTLGTTEELAPLAVALATGTPTLGGSLVTGGGLLFIGATMDKYLRAFDAKTGAELWQGRLPATGFATPMSYEWKGRQYVVIAAGGHGQLGTEPGDSFVAFALPKAGEKRATYWSRTIDRPGGRMWINFALVFAGSLVVVGGLWWLIKRLWRRSKS